MDAIAKKITDTVIQELNGKDPDFQEDGVIINETVKIRDIRGVTLEIEVLIKVRSNDDDAFTVAGYVA